MRSQRRSTHPATIVRPRAGAAAQTYTVDGTILDADVPGLRAGLNNLLVRPTATINLPGFHILGPEDRIKRCGTDWQVVGDSSYWLNRTKVRVQEATPPLHCTIRRQGAAKGSFDDATGTYDATTPTDPYFTGVARTQQASAEARALVVAADDVTTLAYIVFVPVERGDDLDARVGDVVTLAELDVNGAPTGASVEVYLKSYSRSGLTWDYQLICTDKL